MDIYNRIRVLIKKAYYTDDRFEIDSTFALIYHEKPLDVMELSKFVRLSDQLIEVDEHHYFVIFVMTPQDNAYKASQNLLMNLDVFFGDQTSCIVLDSFDTSRSAENVLKRLHMIMAETKKQPFIRIETEDILDDLKR